MTGKGRCLDNIYIERFWRSFKQEEFYLNDYEDVASLKTAIGKYVDFYNNKRWHQSLGYKRPADVYFSSEARLVISVEDQQNYQSNQLNHYWGQSLLNFDGSLV